MSATLGLYERLQPGDERRIDRILWFSRTLGLRHVRLAVAWADWQRAETWCLRAIARLAGGVEVLPVLRHAAPWAEQPDVNGYTLADFAAQVASRLGDTADAVELWPFLGAGRDASPDLETCLPAETLSAAAQALALSRRRVVLGLGAAGPHTLLKAAAAIGAGVVDGLSVYLAPGAAGLPDAHTVRRALGREAELFVTLGRPADAEALPPTVAPDRIYWQSDWSDDHGTHAVERPRLVRPAPRSLPPAERPVLVTGGAGFIGTNLAHRLASGGRRVIVVDNFSRPGAEENAAWLAAEHGSDVDVRVLDVRDAAPLATTAREAGAVVHLAAQVAVTTSLDDPRGDFDVNARGTLNVLEAVRALAEPVPLVYTSTNKVYGDLADVALEETALRYRPTEPQLRALGVSEARRLDFHSPYGCSKGAADQYVLDYARCYGLHAAVFRMSCIYGPHQHGNEDQGWVAHFVIRAMAQGPITIYGDGKQVRDALYVDDLTEAIAVALDRMGALRGRAYNIGGGPDNATSLCELLRLLGQLGFRPPVRYDAWRTGDQRYYVTDTHRFRQATGWRPRVALPAGVQRLVAWLADERAPDVEAHEPGGAHARSHP